MTKELFVGTWRLIGTDFRDADGNPHQPYGEHPSGVLIYDANGHMAGQIVRMDRPRFSGNSVFKATRDELRAAIEGYVAYFGTYEINAQDGTITHHVEGCLLPHWLGTDQTRSFEFSGNRLTLRTPPVRFAVVLTGAFIWERVSPQPDTLIRNPFP
jgi:hypothetical protein